MSVVRFGTHAALRTSTGVTYLHGDHLGSTSVASNASGAFVARQTYYAYGAPRTSDGTLPTDYTFTGQRADASAGLMYYGARYYDAQLGRFIQPDLVIPNVYNPQDLNRYSYVRNNPLKYVDPDGREPITAAAVLAYLGWAAVNTAVDTGIDFVIARLTSEQFNLGQSFAANAAINVATAGIGGKIAKGGKIATLAAKYGDGVANLARTVSRAVPEGRILSEISAESLETIAEHGIKPYGEFKDKGGKAAHHLVEKRFWKRLGFSDPEEAKDKILAVLIDPELHGPRGKGIPTLTDQIRDAIGYQLTNDAELSDIWRVHRDVYEELGYKDWARVIWEVYFQPLGIPYH